jgi:hypothetical protein
VNITVPAVISEETICSSGKLLNHVLRYNFVIHGQVQNSNIYLILCNSREVCSAVLGERQSLLDILPPSLRRLEAIQPQ